LKQKLKAFADIEEKKNDTAIAAIEITFLKEKLFEA